MYSILSAVSSQATTVAQFLFLINFSTYLFLEELAELVSVVIFGINIFVKHTQTVIVRLSSRNTCDSLIRNLGTSW